MQTEPQFTVHKGTKTIEYEKKDLFSSLDKGDDRLNDQGGRGFRGERGRNKPA